MAIDKKLNDFKDHLKVAVIIDVDPQNRTVDVKYTSQDGHEYQMMLPYTNVSGTWGSVHMPIIGDRVLIDNSMGEVPIIKSMVPLNSDYLPYLDPGEIGHQSESGSFLHLKNRRKRVKSTGQLIDYTATMGPNGETDLELEPGGVIMRARSKQMQDQTYSKLDDHAHVAVFDNGDVVLQSMNKNIPKGLLHMDGTSGHTWLHAGDSKVQEYLELNPVKQEIVLFSDGDIHLFSQNDQKISTYTDQIVNVCGSWQFKTGVPTANIPSDFDQIVLDSDLDIGDIRVDNTTGNPGAKMYIHSSDDFNLLDDQGDINFEATLGDINIKADEGEININANLDDINITADDGEIIIAANAGDTTLQAANDVNIMGSSVNIVPTPPPDPGIDAGMASKSIPGGVGLGASFSSIEQQESSAINALGSTGISQKLISSNDIMTFENNQFAARLTDKMDVVAAIVSSFKASGVPSLPSEATVLAAFASLVHLPIPDGSSNVKVNP